MDTVEMIGQIADETANKVIEQIKKGVLEAADAAALKYTGGGPHDSLEASRVAATAYNAYLVNNIFYTIKLMRQAAQLTGVGPAYNDIHAMVDLAINAADANTPKLADLMEKIVKKGASDGRT